MEYSDGMYRRKEPATGLAHPLLDTDRHFVLGDRFHSTTNPHKSELCRYHNLDLCLQANTIKTSGVAKQLQESEEAEKFHGAKFRNTFDSQLLDGLLPE